MTAQSKAEYVRINDTKANFDAIYNLDDPREYFRVLVGLDYIIPELAKSIINDLIQALNKHLRRSIRVLDVGCSYGTNAALARFPLDLQRLAARYADPHMQRLSPEELMRYDTAYFCAWPETNAADFIGLDVSERAVAYGCRTGLLSGGITSNLETTSLKRHEIELIESVDLIVSTGCVGYVTERTFRRLLQAIPENRRPWIANFVLRMFPYDDIAAYLETQSLVTEKLEGVTFVQRRFHSQEECESVLGKLNARGIDPTGKEADGLYHAELFVSRPAKDILEIPMADLVSVTSGANRAYGRRYRTVAPGDVKLFR